MGWLDATEYLFMELVVRDRIDDLRSTIDVALARADGAGVTTRDVVDPVRGRPEDGAPEHCRVRWNGMALGAPGVPR
jgi:hypothetical protein